MSSAEGYALPQSGVPKTLGILNIIFGVVMFLAGTCILGTTLAYPAIMDMLSKTVKEAQAKEQSAKDAEAREFDEQEKAATTEEAKKAIRDQKAASLAARPQIVMPDLESANEIMKNPTIKTHQLLFWGSGAILSLMLLVSGIGLVRLASWGRTFVLVWAGVQLVQLVILSSYEMIVVNPVQQAMSEKMFEKMEADIKAGKGAPGAAENVKLGRLMASLAIPRIVGMGVIGSIYPIIVLILINTRGARAAFLAKRKLEASGGI